MYERRHVRLLPLHKFLKRVLIHVGIALALIAVSLGVGIWGYMHFEGLDLIDAYQNASMILSGMGPVAGMATDGGKIFAGSYALFSGIIFLVAVAVLMIPLFHRFLHHFLLTDIQ